MTYTTTKLPRSEIEILVKLEDAEMKNFYEKALLEASRDLEIEGFRKGKAPADIVKKRAGEERIWERALVLAVEKTYPEIIKTLSVKEKGEFEPIGAPKVEIMKKNDAGACEYKARLAILPPVVLPDYKNIAKVINAGKQKPEVTAEEIERAIEWLRDSRSSLVTVRRPAQKGDRVEIDFAASLDGVALANGKSQNHPLIIGENKFVPGFEENLIGMEVNEEKKFSLVAPENYMEKSLAGKKLDFTVHVKLIQQKILPELSDTFAAGLGNFKDVEALKKSVATGLAMEKEEKERSERRIKIIDAVAEKISVEPPDLLIERELDKMTGELRSSIERMGIAWNDYLANLKKTEDVIKKDWGKDAVRRVKIALALRKIGQAEKLEPTTEEMQETTTQTVSRMNIDPENLKKIDSAAFLEYNTTIARNEKVFQFLENQ